RTCTSTSRAGLRTSWHSRSPSQTSSRCCAFIPRLLQDPEAGTGFPHSPGGIGSQKWRFASPRARPVGPRLAIPALGLTWPARTAETSTLSCRIMASPTAADILVETLCAWGVDTIFGLPGDGINGIMESLRAQEKRIRFIQVRHEESAAFMACAYAKYTG